VFAFCLLAVGFSLIYFYLWRRQYPEIQHCFEDSFDWQEQTFLTSVRKEEKSPFATTPLSPDNLQQVQELNSFDTPGTSVTSLAISSDNDFVLAGYLNGGVKFFSPSAEGKLLNIAASDSITSISIGENNWIAAIYTFRGEIILLNLLDGSVLARWSTGNASDRNKLAFVHDAGLIYSSAKTIYQCSLDSKENITMLRNQAVSEIADIEVDTQVKNLIYSTDGDNDSTGIPEIGVISLDNPNLVNRLNIHNTQITSIAFSSEGQRAASISVDGVMNITEIPGYKHRSIKAGGTKNVSVYTLVLNSNGSVAIVGSSDSNNEGTLLAFDLIKQSVIDTPNLYSSGITALRISQTGSLVASGDFKGTVKLWGIKGN
jgi:WD40 repeat protein